MNLMNISPKLACFLAVIFLFLTPNILAKNKSEEVLTPVGAKLLASYQSSLTELRKELQAVIPTITPDKKDAFLKFHEAVKNIPILPNPQNLKAGPVTYAPGNPVYVGAQGNALMAVRPILKEAKPFLKGNDHHAKLAKCALLNAGAHQMALYAQSGEAQKSDVDYLLGNDKLMIEVMELGGAYQGKYGQAIRNYRAILKASKDSDKEFFRLWAIASSLEHPDGNHVPEGKTASEAIVEFYLDYVNAHKKGILDEAFKTLTPWDSRFIFPFIPLTEVRWMRKMIRNYRPDVMRLDYKWRYCRITKTDVPYTSNVPRPVRPDLGVSRFQDYFLEGGICGPRAFTGRAATHAFGIPSRPAPQTGHAAMSHWTPDGWVTVFGAHWTHNRFRGQCGLDFELESRSRSIDEEYRQVHRANWLGDVMNEKGVDQMAFGVGGGFWKALAFYKKLTIVEEAELEELETVGEEFAESNVPAASPVSNWSEEDGSEEDNKSDFPQIELSEEDQTIVYAEDGTITIPAAACYKAESTEKIRFMKSIDEKFVQVHYSLGGSRPELLKYIVNAPEAGKYSITSEVVTVTVDRSYLLRVNRRNLFEIPLPYTLGEWEETKPVEIDLKKGRNTILFTLKSNNKGVSLRAFSLKPTGGNG
jgi:hypothetical protein